MTVDTYERGPVGSVFCPYCGVSPWEPCQDARGRDLKRPHRQRLQRSANPPKCRICGCTDFQACEQGCAWVLEAGLESLCSSCAPALPGRRPA